MASLRFYIADFNGMLTSLKQKLAGHLTTPREADVWICWQDIQGSYGDIISNMKKLGISKPVYVVQHGRGATFDYGPPNNFKLNADKFLCWGLHDYENMCKLGYKDKVKIVGCPLNPQILPLVKHEEKVVLFVPVNTGKEEPENIAVYYELMKLKYEKAKCKVLNFKDVLKDHWGFNRQQNVKFNELVKDFDVVAKLLPWHDQQLYHGSILRGFQDHPSNMHTVFSLLRNVDAVVGLDEGTTEIFAYGHNVPVIVVDGFKYRQHDYTGINYNIVDPYRSEASTHVSLSDLQSALDYALLHPEHKQQERKIEAERQLGLSYGDPISNILRVIKNDLEKLKKYKNYYV